MGFKEADYKSIFIPKEVIITVGRNGSAYVCDAENKKTLATANMWANYNRDDEDQPAEQYRYINDNFYLKIKHAAKGSSVGGKLSFWLCEVTAPDNRVFNIGVNSELLCELICSSCFISGSCQEPVKFGTQNNQYGFYTYSMPSYKKYLESEKLRDEVKNNNTTKYKPGDIVRTLTESKLYLGELYQYMDIRYKGSGHFYSWQSPGINDIEIVLYKNPRKLHAFASSYKQDEWELWPDTGLLKKKPKRLLTGATFDHNKVLNEFMAKTIDQAKKALDDNDRWYPYGLLADLIYGEQPILMKMHVELIQNRLTTKILKLVAAGKIRYPGEVSYVYED